MRVNLVEIEELYDLYLNDLSENDNKLYNSYYDNKPFYVTLDFNLERIYFKTINDDSFDFVCIVSIDKLKKITFDIVRYSDDSSIGNCVTILENLGYDINEINYFVVLVAEMISFLTDQAAPLENDSFIYGNFNFSDFEKIYDSHFKDLSTRIMFNVDYLVNNNQVVYASHNDLNNTIVVKSRDNANVVLHIAKLSKFKVMVFDLLCFGKKHDFVHNSNLLNQLGYKDDDVKYLLTLSINMAMELSSICMGNEDLVDIEDDEDDETYEEIQLNELESIEENLNSGDYSYRDLYATDHFKKYYMNAPEEQKNYIDDILDNFKNCKTQKELNEYLYRKNNKKLRSARLNVDKLYVDNNSGHRLVWGFMSKFSEKYPKGSIIFIEYITVHDDQSKVAHNLRRSDLLNITKLCEMTTQSSDNEKNLIPPYKYYHNSWIPQLTEAQKKTTMVQAPALIYGCAGSGKTLVSIELFAHYLKNNEDVYYVTYSQDLVEKVRKDLSQRTDVSINVINNRVLTIRNYFIKKLNIDKNNINFVDLSVFDEWKRNNYLKKNQNKYSKLDSEFVWTYIKGIIKGDDIVVKNRDYFIKQMYKKEGIDHDISELIYDIYLDYQMFVNKKASSFNIFGAKNNNLDIYDDDDLAKAVLKNNSILDSESMLVVDEVQDLTYIQIMALNHIVKNANIIMCGDGNQRINPTIIDLNSIERVFYDRDFYDCKFEYINLPHSFRSSYGIIVFLNHLSDLRRKYIALQDSKYEIKEISIRNSEEGLWPIYCDKKYVDFNKVCQLAADSANSIIIVPNDSVKEKLISCNHLLDGRVMDIQQVKGLEYDNVIIYDFVSTYKDEFLKILNNERTRDTFGRLLFNYLYVACTRAKESLLICENDCDLNMQGIIYENVGVQTSYETIHSIVMLEEDDDSWYGEAKRLEECKEYKMAVNAYGKIKNRDCSIDIERCEILQQVKDVAGMRNVDNKLNKIKECGDRLLKMSQWNAAQLCFAQVEEDSANHEILIENIYLNSILQKHMDDGYVKRYIKESLDKESNDKIYMLIPYMKDVIEETKNLINKL